MQLTGKAPRERCLLLLYDRIKSEKRKRSPVMEIKDILNRDPETLIYDILRFYKNGAEGKTIVPKKLLEASPYNQGIMEILKLI